MAESSIIPGTPDSSVKILKDTLHTQQDLLQQLYTELDVEREAAATATDESLSMMLRLQGEKAAVEMEACQYKRIAEEKMVHAEETLATFRDLIYQKEMQIASLEFQVQAYKFKLISLGCNDVGECDPHYPENMFLKRGGQSHGDASNLARLRRGISLPPSFLKDGEDPNTDGEGIGETCLQTVPERRGLDLSHLKSGGDFSCYWEQIKKLDERIKEFSSPEDLPETESDDKLDEMENSVSMQSQGSSSSFYDALRGEMTPRVDGVEGRDMSKGAATPSKEVQDIFEVPQTTIVCEIEKSKSSVEADISPWKADAIKLGIPCFMDKNNRDRKAPMSPNIDNIIHKTRDGLGGVDQLYFKRPDVHDLELQQMNRRLKRLEDERITVRPETPRFGMARHEICSERDDEHMRVLKSIKDQLNSIEEEMISWRPKMAKPVEQLDLTSLAETMMHFW